MLLFSKHERDPEGEIVFKNIKDLFDQRLLLTTVLSGKHSWWFPYSMISDQNCTTRSLITTALDPF